MSVPRGGPEIDLVDPHGYCGLRLEELRAWLRELLATVANGWETFAVRFVDEDEMRRMNREFREIDRPTDILSFPGDETPDGRHLGDVAISVPTAAKQASSRGHSLGREIRVLLLHGALHCLGYDHETDDGTMDRLEEELREEWIEGMGA